MKRDKLNIAIDARPLEGPRKGIGRYLFSLLDYFPTHQDEWRINLLFHREIPAVLPQGNFEVTQINSPHAYLWEQIALPCYLNYQRPDLFLAPANILPLIQHCPTVLILHDTMMFEPELSLLDAQRYYTYQSWILHIKARSCNSIITVSNFSAQQIAIYLGKAISKKIVVITEGVEERFSLLPSQKVLQNYLDKYALKAGYILHFASSVPRKNTRITLEALSMLKREGIILPQIFLPGLCSHDQIVMSWLKEFGIDAITAPYLSEEEMPLAYAAAGILLYPSRWEGFGLPLLEGMAAGLPIIAANATSIPELAGGCAWLIPPDNAAEMARIIKRWLENPQTGKEFGLRAKKRANSFRWENTAKGVKKVLEEVLNQY